MERCGFFDANLVGDTYDRVYLASQFAAYFASFIGNGIFGGKSDELQVLSATNPAMQIVVSGGQGWINGYWYENTDALPIPLDVADGSLNRIDSVVLRIGYSERSIWLAVKKGTPATNPIAPSITRNADYYELQLATVSIPAGCIKITQSQINDTRLDSTVCGWVTGLVEQADTSTLYLQIQDALTRFEVEQEADFIAWYNGVKDFLTEDVALKLQSQIDEITACIFKRHPIQRIMDKQGWTNEDVMGMKTTDIARVMEDNSIVYFTFNSTNYLCTDIPNNGGTNKGICTITRLQENRVLVDVDIEADGKYFMFVTKLDGVNQLEKVYTKSMLQNVRGTIINANEGETILSSRITDGNTAIKAASVVVNFGIPSDAPINTEAHIVYLGDNNDAARQRVLFIDYGGGAIIYARSIFNGEWNSEWARVSVVNDVVTNNYVDIGVDDYTKVAASIGMVTLGNNRAIITINYQICMNNGATDNYRFIDVYKLARALGLSGLAFAQHQTTVTFQPCIDWSTGVLQENTSYASAYFRGYTGLMFDEYGGLCRIYDDDGNFGAWPLSAPVYRVGTYGTIVINGALIS